MKNTIDEKTINQLVSKLVYLFEPGKLNINLPNFEYKAGSWVHDNHHSITVVKDFSELKEPKSKPDWPYLLGIYKIETARNEGKLIIFPDAIKDESKRYADNKSIIVENGKKVGDLRNTHDSWGGGARPNGLFESDAFNYIEILCKIELILLDIIHNRLRPWKSEFYSINNIDYIDILVMQITKDVIKGYDELVDCFTWLNINDVTQSEFLFNTPINFIENIAGSDEQEWSIINKLDIFINCFPIDEKTNAETWKAFFIRTKEITEDSLMKLVNDRQGLDRQVDDRPVDDRKYDDRKVDDRKDDPIGAGWEIINDYLTKPENKHKCEIWIRNIRYGRCLPYTFKWWKTWN